ncbi:MAG TPA: 3D domain-containing protein [Pyrinomonadaceae bacterium]|jgi:3D (Asp-Asp-Asp) domain-containing protein|nr:3D domain-containing protein [Pyrinomonadaceae bacterium]
MKNLVRGGVILSLISLFVVLMYAQTKTETEHATVIANDSQAVVNNLNTEEKLAVDDKKLVKKTVMEKAASSGLSRGSFTATAYCLRGRTAMGHGVRRGIIAADPRVLRLGSTINLGAGAYSGQYLVSDTGGGIKGRRLDIWVPNCSEARRFGRRTVTVFAAQ